ncbi:CD1247 N-terminal domain-containing protein [Ruminococcus sp.]|uniref:CD1247 N-terminal domain-containing protein n=1 Tax=Ruminococcus sp. TaxID=41978 RepID=UPI003862FF80
MNLTEKISYIRGLCEGLALDESKPEVKVINAIIDLLDDMSYSVTDMEDLYDELSAQVDEIDQDLAEAETELYGEDDDFDYDEDDDDYEDFDDEDDNVFYEVTCDACGQKLNVSEDVLLEGEIECPNCGELLEFDFSDIFDGEECDPVNCEGCESNCNSSEE